MCWGKWGQRKDLLGLAVGGQCNHWACSRRNGSARSWHTRSMSTFGHPGVPAEFHGLAPWASYISVFSSTVGASFLRQEPLKFSWSIHPSLCLKAGWSQTPFLRFSWKILNIYGWCYLSFSWVCCTFKTFHINYLVCILLKQMVMYFLPLSLSLSHTHTLTQTFLLHRSENCR